MCSRCALLFLVFASILAVADIRGIRRMPGAEDTGSSARNYASPDDPPTLNAEGNLHVEDEPGQVGWNPTKKAGFRARQDFNSKEGDQMPGFNPFKQRSRFAERHPEKQFPEDEFGNPGGGPFHSSDQAGGSDKKDPLDPKGDPEKQKALDVSKKCLKHAIKHCPMRVMHENFAAYTMCVFDNRAKLPGDCEQWATFQGDCVQEMLTNCAGLDPETTTDCMMKAKNDLSSDCTSSQFFESMEEGYDAYKDRMKRGRDKASFRPDSKFEMPQGFPGGMPDMGNFDPSQMPKDFDFSKMPKMPNMQGGKGMGNMPGQEEMMKRMNGHFHGAGNQQGGMPNMRGGNMGGNFGGGFPGGRGDL